MLLVILKAKKLLDCFKKGIAKNKSKRLYSQNVDKLYVKWKGYNSYFNSWNDKKRHGVSEWTFSRTNSLEGRVKFELDLSYYATKSDLENAAGVDTSKFAKKSWFS